jgi:hypothetical protein
VRIIITLALLLFATVAHAAEPKTFYKQEIPGKTNWTVFGTIFNDPNNSDKCSAEIAWEDGSLWQLTKHLDESSPYIAIRNADWQISDAPQTRLNVQANAYDENNKFVEGSNLGFTLVNKNTMFSMSLNGDKFIEAVFNSHRMVFIPPGNIPNITVYWGESNAKIMVALANCVSEGREILKGVGKTRVEPKGFKATPNRS